MEESEARVVMMEKEVGEFKSKFDEMLFSYQALEEELIEERAAHRETKLRSEHKQQKRYRFQ